MEKDRFKKRYNRNEHKHKWRRNYPFGKKSVCQLSCKICHATKRVNTKKLKKPLKILFFVFTILLIQQISALELICDISEGNLTLLSSLWTDSMEKEIYDRFVEISNDANKSNTRCIISPGDNNLNTMSKFIIDTLNQNLRQRNQELKICKRNYTAYFIASSFIIISFVILYTYKVRKWNKTQ